MVGAQPSARPARAPRPPRPPRPLIGNPPYLSYYWRDGDPEGPHRAIPVLARLVASGLLWQGEVEDTLRAAAPCDDLHRRLTGLFTRELEGWTRRRCRTERRIYRNIALPLLRGGRPGWLLDRLQRLADWEDPEGNLRPEERRTLVMAEVAWAIRTGHLSRDHLPPGPMLPHDPLTFGDLRRW